VYNEIKQTVGGAEGRTPKGVKRAGGTFDANDGYINAK